MASESTALGWKVLGVILLVSATLNAIQVIVVHDATVQILRASLSGSFSSWRSSVSGRA